MSELSIRPYHSLVERGNHETQCSHPTCLDHRLDPGRACLYRHARQHPLYFGKCLLGTLCRLAAARAGNTPEGSIDPKTEKGCRFRQPFLCLNGNDAVFEKNISNGGELFIYLNWDHKFIKPFVSTLNNNRIVEIFDRYTIIIVYQRKE